MLVKLTDLYINDLYAYFCFLSQEVPYYFHVDRDNWYKSMFHDCDWDGTPLFNELVTYILIREGAIKGFIQFGVSSFAFDDKGAKNSSLHYGIIRNIHFQKDESEYELLIQKAIDYLKNKGIENKYAFFHYFGMSCYARQGKLYGTYSYIEDVLKKYSFVKEHENVYYSKRLRAPIPVSEADITLETDNNYNNIRFIMDGKEIGGCELNFLVCGDICFLKWIYIKNEYSHQGLGTKCMNLLFATLHKMGIKRLDTDTADNNINAQKYYLKTGFMDMGVMRSYLAKSAM